LDNTCQKASVSLWKYSRAYETTAIVSTEKAMDADGTTRLSTEYVNHNFQKGERVDGVLMGICAISDDAKLGVCNSSCWGVWCIIYH
jgi:hypothetical protein